MSTPSASLAPLMRKRPDEGTLDTLTVSFAPLPVVEPWQASLITPCEISDLGDYYRLCIPQQLAGGFETLSVDLTRQQMAFLFEIWQSYPLPGMGSFHDAFCYHFYSGYHKLAERFCTLESACSDRFQQLFSYLFLFLSNIHQLACRPEHAGKSDTGLSAKSFHRSYPEVIEKLEQMRTLLTKEPLVASFHVGSGHRSIKTVQDYKQRSLQEIRSSLQQLLQELHGFVELSKATGSLKLLAEVDFDGVFYRLAHPLASDAWLQQAKCWLFLLEARAQRSCLAHHDAALSGHLQAIDSALKRTRASQNYTTFIQAIKTLFIYFGKKFKHSAAYEGTLLLLMRRLSQGEIDLPQVVASLNWNPSNHQLSDFHLSRWLAALRAPDRELGIAPILIDKEQEGPLIACLRGTLSLEEERLARAISILSAKAPLLPRQLAWVRASIAKEYQHLQTQAFLKLSSLREEYGWILAAHAGLISCGLQLLSESKAGFTLKFDALIAMAVAFEQESSTENRAIAIYLIHREDIPEGLRAIFRAVETSFQKLNLAPTAHKLHARGMDILEEALSTQEENPSIALRSLIHLHYLHDKLESKLTAVTNLYRLLLSAIRKELGSSKDPEALLRWLIQAFQESCLGPYEKEARCAHKMVAILNEQFYSLPSIKAPSQSHSPHETLLAALEKDLRELLRKKIKAADTSSPFMAFARPQETPKSPLHAHPTSGDTHQQQAQAELEPSCANSPSDILELPVGCSSSPQNLSPTQEQETDEQTLCDEQAPVEPSSTLACKSQATCSIKLHLEGIAPLSSQERKELLSALRNPRKLYRILHQRGYERQRQESSHRMMVDQEGERLVVATHQRCDVSIGARHELLHKLQARS